MALNEEFVSLFVSKFKLPAVNSANIFPNYYSLAPPNPSQLPITTPSSP